MIPLFGIGWTELLVISFVSLVVFLPFWIWMLVDCLKSEPEGSNEKLIWTLVILLGGIIGALIYLVVRRRARVAQAR